MTQKRQSRDEMIRIFIDACIEVIQEKGHDQTGIREVARRSGYRPATIYNYFQNFDHLMLYASMRLLGKYTKALDHYLAQAENALDKFLLIWDCFCHYSYAEPEIYQYRFYLYSDSEGNKLVQQYYEDFPEELQKDWSPAVRSMLTRTKIEDRNMALVEELAEEGYIAADHCEMLNNLTTILFEGFFSRVLRRQMTAEAAHKLTMHYFAIVMNCHLKKKADSKVFLRFFREDS